MVWIVSSFFHSPSAPAAPRRRPANHLLKQMLNQWPWTAHVVQCPVCMVLKGQYPWQTLRIYCIWWLGFLSDCCGSCPLATVGRSRVQTRPWFGKRTLFVGTITPKTDIALCKLAGKKTTNQQSASARPNSSWATRNIVHAGIVLSDHGDNIDRMQESVLDFYVGGLPLQHPQPLRLKIHVNRRQQWTIGHRTKKTVSESKQQPHRFVSNRPN